VISAASCFPALLSKNSGTLRLPLPLGYPDEVALCRLRLPFTVRRAFLPMAPRFGPCENLHACQRLQSMKSLCFIAWTGCVRKFTKFGYIYTTIQEEY
jgi:hypothetical protein